MAPSSYAADYIEFLNKQGRLASTAGSAALDPEPVEAVPTRTEVRKENRRERELMTIAAKLPKKIVTTPVMVRTAAVLILIGALLILSVWMGPKATAIKYSINTMTKENVQLRDQITMLGIEIEGAVSFESIESYASKNLKMVYPKKNQCIYIDEDETVDKDLVKTIRRKAYGN